MTSEILGYAFPLAFTPSNILSGFRVSGIWPFNRDVFGDDEFFPSSVTDRPDPSLTNIASQSDGPASVLLNEPLPTHTDPIDAQFAVIGAISGDVVSISCIPNTDADGMPSTSSTAALHVDLLSNSPRSSTQLNDLCHTPSSMTAVKSITPESLRPHPKAGPRKKNGGRKKVKP